MRRLDQGDFIGMHCRSKRAHIRWPWRSKWPGLASRAGALAA